MNTTDDKLKNLLDRAFPDTHSKAPAPEMWDHIRHHLPSDRPVTNRQRIARRWLIPAGVLGMALISIMVYLHDPGLPSISPVPTTGSGEQAVVNQLRNLAPGIYEQNKPAIVALDMAIEEVRHALETRPGDILLQSRLAYYRSWQHEMITELLEWNEGKTDATG